MVTVRPPAANHFQLNLALRSIGRRIRWYSSDEHRTSVRFEQTRLSRTLSGDGYVGLCSQSSGGTQMHFLRQSMVPGRKQRSWAQPTWNNPARQEQCLPICSLRLLRVCELPTRQYQASSQDEEDLFHEATD